MSASLLLKHYFILASLPFLKCPPIQLFLLGKDTEKKIKGVIDKKKETCISFR